MSFAEIEKILGKQLQLLSQRSQKCRSAKRLAELTEAMANIIRLNLLG